MSGDAFPVDGIAFRRNEDWLADDWRSRTASSESIFSEKRGIVASTEFGMDNLMEVERIDKENPTRLKHSQPNNPSRLRSARMPTSQLGDSIDRGSPRAVGDYAAHSSSGELMRCGKPPAQKCCASKCSPDQRCEEQATGRIR